MGNDVIDIEILPDGSIKVSTDKVSASNHMNAEKFLQFMAELAGGTTQRTRKAHAHTHSHKNTHEGAKQ
jgi:hypothetical protein